MRLRRFPLCVSLSSTMTTKRTPETLTADAERRERLAGALRENLKRRKAQARGRREEGRDGAKDKEGKEPEGRGEG
jgi:hypothetical protein